MGYTHYWGFKAPIKGQTAKVERAYQKAIKECTKLCQAYQAEATGSDRLSGYSAYTSKYGGLKVNGKQDNAHEDFTMREHFKQNQGGFCKTARKPYDAVVVACLVILKHYLKDNFDVASDGYAADWVDGHALVARYLGKPYAIPETIQTKRRLQAA